MRMKWPLIGRVVTIRAKTLRKGVKESTSKEGATIVELGPEQQERETSGK